MGCIKALFKTLKDFCNKSSLTAFRYLVDPRKTYLERCIWLLLQLFLFVGAIMMILQTIKDTLENPLITSLETVRYPIENVAFPGVSICNINKISKKRAIDLARLLSDKGNFPFDDIFNKLKILGKLYDYEVGEIDVNELLTLQIYLEQYGIVGNDSNNNYLYRIMKNLSVPCEELMHECHWKGKARNCSDLFKLRRTYEGFCCIFNYARNSLTDLDFQYPKQEKYLPFAGKEMGLTVTLRNDPDDYFYPLMSFIGTNIHIFNPRDYPDDTSSSLIQILIGIGTENILELNAKTIWSVPEVQKYPISIRKCIFPNEVETFYGTYSLNNCLVTCRVESILALCNCVPLLIPWYPNASICLLSDIPCLNKYQEKWLTLFPTGLSDSDVLKHEKQNSLQCDHCYTGCTNTRYSIATNWAPLNLRDETKQQHENNFSVIHIYYGSFYTKLYKQDVLYYWFETLSNIGGVLGIFLGISFMSIMEFLYFITIRFVSILIWNKM